MKRTDEGWRRLVQAARQAPDHRELEMPQGFATRIVAQSRGEKRVVGSLVERFAPRALGVSCVLAVLGVAGNYSVVAQSARSAFTENFFTLDDPASIVLGVTDHE